LPAGRARPTDFDDALIGQELGVFDDLRRRLGPSPPDPLVIESLRPLGQRTLSDDPIEDGDDLGAMAPDGRRIGKTRIADEVRTPEGTADRGDVPGCFEPDEENQRPSAAR
jgi:hypothetical protein